MWRTADDCHTVPSRQLAISDAGRILERAVKTWAEERRQSAEWEAAEQAERETAALYAKQTEEERVRTGKRIKDIIERLGGRPGEHSKGEEAA